ncbi:putative pilin/flagellin [Halapricum desulfuricans]|uniref:Putative pilin/flagellin n=2 Tax=Halapricum desulfuricans TaxID=2841257 RepID=A0A897NFM2_9EURY|nr:putative pilin/flagellin [Halapricum desulfuricans]
MLIAGFVLAVAFLAVAVMLNAVIYSENLATRDEDARGAEAIAYRADMVDGAEQLIEYANANRSTFANRTGEFNESVRAMYNSTALLQSTDGIATDLAVTGVTRGTFIGQFNASRTFTNDQELSSWTLVNNTYGTRAFRINITDQDALEDGAGNGFTVHVNGSATWSAEIYDDGGNTTVDVDGAGSCTVGSTPEIDLTAGTVDGSPCEALAFGEDVSAPYSIEFENADAIAGNYSLVVNSTEYEDDNYDGTNYHNDRDSPFVDDEAIYAATLRLRHESPDHVYATDATVVPGENDA